MAGKFLNDGFGRLGGSSMRLICSDIKKTNQTNQTDNQTDGHADRWTDRRTYRQRGTDIQLKQIEKETERHTTQKENTPKK